MATETDIISTARLREAIGEIGDESDDVLASLRSAAVDYLENYTGRSVLDRAGYETEDTEFYRSMGCEPDWIEWRVTDVKAGDLVISYSDWDADPMGQGDRTMTIPTTDRRVKLTRDSVKIFSNRGEEWSKTLRFDYPTPMLTADRGMASGGIPPAWSDACALMVRALYDGSAYDDLGEMSALKYLLKPYWRGAYMRTART